MPSPAGSPLYDAEEEDNEMQESVEYHPAVNGMWNILALCFDLMWSSGKPCDSEGNILQDGTPPLPFIYRPPDDFTPFEDRASFELADLLYRRNQMPASQINDLLQIWSAKMNDQDSSPFVNSNDLYSSIDATTIGSVPWQSFSVSYQGEIETESPPSWKTTEYEVFFRDPCEVLKTQLANPDFANEMDFSPKRVTDRQGKHRYQDFMSGNWAWQQAVRAYFIPIILYTALLICIFIHRIVFRMNSVSVISPTVPLLLVAIKPPSQLLQDRMNITHCMHPMA